MSRYILAPSAKADLKEINSYLTRNNPNAALNFRQKLKQQFKLLADFPNMGRSRDELEPDLRSFPLDDYLIFYRPINQGVEVVRILSGYRDLKTLFNQENDEAE